MNKILSKLACSSILWGLVATFGYYFAIENQAIANPTLARYSTGHPVEYVTIAMFWLGLFDVAFKSLRTLRERRLLKRGTLFPPKRQEREPLTRVDDYLKAIDQARDVRGESVYLTRLTEALNFLKHGGSPEELDQELRILADDAYDQRENEYGMTRAFIWAIPILGFLGTVLGINVALGSLDLTQLETTGENLAAGLKVAFDTTALALTLVFALYFGLFFSRKQDAKLAQSVARMADVELRGRFASRENTSLTLEGDGDSTQIALRLAQTLVTTFEEATQRQTENLQALNAQITNLTSNLAQGMAQNLGVALQESMTHSAQSWTEQLTTAQSQFLANVLQPLMEDAARQSERSVALERQLEKQCLAIADLASAAANVSSLEEQFANSLERIAQVGEFEQTLTNLSATVCLLNSKLASTRVDARESVRLANFSRHSVAQESVPIRAQEDDDTIETPSVPDLEARDASNLERRARAKERQAPNDAEPNDHAPNLNHKRSA
ncbi:MAG: MotA/TolQ/ExbB proton channel family protein [Planctomycetia bacterium]|nr:MotA/TolQ/ExbB proton channel family protein [Planctomycetia bacterium]